MLEDRKRVGYPCNMARKILKEKYPQLNKNDLPINVEEIAEGMGFEIHRLDSMDDNHSAIIMRDTKLIGLNSKHHIHRVRFSLGHELGHYLLGHNSEEDSMEDEIKIFNQEADEFAAELLVPLQLFKELIKEINIDELSKTFLVSRHVIVIKAQSARLFSYLN